ncbi:nuclear transcription factor Y subunit gamma [Tribolium castaneum]|uniref:Nuclear transcription factor Y subunit gamma n=1 Tax=Tribolium castaneum TaxID=7070 RepID=D6WSU7_TRICA|nr:PREDICTED: nuclear transcription factor Y subunit gamma [Tribolium castaneum]EFA06660.1 Nuclear transcription factor Y subunit gamma-like Protein [Tribolium castaneum]|eukprot:XP_966912.1 PREDICTED: nuclear transcription factor Y subunit gamma [Tribolium castaneum]
MSVYYLNTAETTDEKTEPQCVEDQCQTQSEAQNVLNQFWPKAMEDIRAIRNMDLKQQVLPLARIKKIMKLDEDVKMISAEAPLLFAKAAEIFIQELTLRAWIHTEDNKRRTLQRNDIAMAISKYDQFDFLIDIVPRDDMKPAKPREDATRTSNSDQVYYFQLAQQHHANLQQNTGAGTATAATAPTTVTQAQGAIQIVQPQQVQTVQVNALDQNAASSSPPNTSAQTPVLIQAGQAIAQNQPGNVQIVQQIVTPSGEIQQIPINLTPQQLQMIKMQLQGNTSQPVIIQTAPIATSQPHLIQVAQQGSGPQQVFLTQSNGNTESE